MFDRLKIAMDDPFADGRADISCVVLHEPSRSKKRDRHRKLPERLLHQMKAIEQIRPGDLSTNRRRIRQAEIDRILYRTPDHNKSDQRAGYRRISGRNQLVGRIVNVSVSGLLGQVTISVEGQPITALITSGAVREMKLKKGQTAAALIKTTQVMIIKVQQPRTSIISPLLKYSYYT